MRLHLAVIAVAFFAITSAARADLTGATIHGEYDFPSQGTAFEDLGNLTPTASGVWEDLFDYEITPTQVIFTNASATGFSSGSFNGFVFTDTSGDPGIIGITLDPSSTLTGGVATFTSNSLAFNFQGLDLTPTSQAIYDIQFAPSTATPEPSGLLLLGTAALGLAGTLRRKLSR